MLIREMVSLPAGGFADVTALAERCAAGTAAEGICTVTVLDPRAGVLLSDGDRRAQRDLLEDMERVFPGRSSYHTRDEADRTAAASKSAVFGAAQSMPVSGGTLRLGAHQRLLAASYAGVAQLELAIQIIQQ